MPRGGICPQQEPLIKLYILANFRVPSTVAKRKPTTYIQTICFKMLEGACMAETSLTIDGIKYVSSTRAISLKEVPRKIE